MKKTTIAGLIGIILIILFLFILPRLTDWIAWPYVLVAAALVILIILVRWHAHRVGYICPACDYLFTITPLTDFLSPQLGEKLLRCPRCASSLWCREIDRSSVPKQNLTAPITANEPLPTDWFLYIQMFIVIAIYLFIWGYTLIVRSTLSSSVSSLTILRIPLSMIILPAAHAAFCLFAIRNGYKGRIYLVVTGLVAFFLIMSAWAQISLISNLK